MSFSVFFFLTLKSINQVWSRKQLRAPKPAMAVYLNDPLQKVCLLRLTVGKKERVKSTFIAASVPQIYDILH